MSTKSAFKQHNEVVNLQSAGLTKPFLLETYRQLSERFKEKLRSKGCREKTLENYDSAVAGWLDHKRLTWDSPLGAEFGTRFQEELEDYLARLKTKRRKIKNVTKTGFSEGTIKNRKSALTKLRQASLEQGKFPTKPSKFSHTLNEVIENSGLSRTAFAKAADVDQPKLSDWSEGRHRPTTVSAIDDLRKIEAHCGLPKDTLVDLAGLSTKGHPPDQQPRSSYSLRQQQRTFEKYKLHKFPTRLHQECQAWYDLMTPPIEPEGKLRRNGRWYVDPETGKCPTNDRIHQSLAGFFGYLILPVEGKQFPIYKREKDERKIDSHSVLVGEGYSNNNLTLALFGVVTLVRAYIEFLRKRSGSYNEETLHLINLGCMLLREETGFIRQQSEYGERLSPQVPADKWDEWCEDARHELRKLRRDIIKSDCFQQSRNVLEPIDFIIDDKHPMWYLFELTARMEADLPPAAFAKIERAIAYRDMFLARLMTGNPLRIKQFAEMTWHSNNTGNLYKDQKGNWRLRFPKEAFKNRKTLRKRDRAKNYGAPVAPSLKPYIEEYLLRQRPLLIGSDKCHYVFRPGPSGGIFKHKTGDNKAMQPASLSKILFKAARKYLRCMGFGAHAYRHILATDYIKNNKNGLMVAAAILHDAPETVLKYYGHYQNADFYEHWIDYHEREFELSRKRLLREAA